jgi:sugar lactone lactonase YvrE
MTTHSALCRAAALLLLAAPTLCLAVDTHVWEQSEQADFARGTPKNLSIRSDGHISLAPEFKELDSTNEPYLWAVAQDSKGTLFYAGGAPTGATAKVYALAAGAKPKVLAELAGLEVHALAVDAQDRLYAAVLPDAKIYRIDAAGKSELFFDAKCKYVWSMAFDHSGNLFVATGDAGIIYKVTPDGKGAQFFDTQETHARSMAIDSAGNLIVGTEPGGLILRITPQAQGFVLYQANRREVTAVAERDGLIYAAAVGNKPLSVSPAPSPALPGNVPAVSAAGARAGGNQAPALPPPIGSLTAGVAGGSEVYRIQKDGFAERIWNSSVDVVYAIAFDAAGKPLLGSGNKGIIQRVDSDQLSTELLNTPPTQVTAFLQGKNGLVYAVTGNVGNLYAIGPALQAGGTLASDILDAGDFAHWGKVHLTSQLHGGTISVETRSGNLNHPENNWSPWSKVAVSELGGPVQSPAARFLQYRLTLTKSSAGESPDLSVVDIAYLPKNAAPRVQQIELAPFNYRQAPSTQPLERAVQPSGSPTSLTLPAVGQRRSSTSTALDAGVGSTLQYAKGFVTARWNASDANSDPLLFKVELRGRNESVWRLLKDKLQDRYFAFDSSAFPDGGYIVRVTASDEAGNTPADTLTSSLESDSFIIDNTPPEIVNVVASSNAVKFTAKDALSWIDKTEYSVNGGEWTLLMPENLVTDSQVLSYSVPAKEGELVAVRVFDENDNVAVKQIAVKP